MAKTFGKKTLLLLALILALVVTTLGVATAETTVEELVLESDSEVVVMRRTTLSGVANTVDITYTPVVKAKINGAWVYVDNKDITWSQEKPTFGGTAKVDTTTGIVWGDGTVGGESEVDTITGEYMGLTISFTARSADVIATKEDMEVLASQEIGGKTGAEWVYNRYYALLNDIDYSSEVWTARYLRPISKNGAYAKPTGIWGDTVATGTWPYVAFGATFDGRGYTIKNAVLPLLSYAEKDSDLGRYVPAFQNVIGWLYGGTFKNVKFEGLVFENKDEAAASPFYTKAGNENLAFLADTNSDNLDDTTGLPVIVEDGEVVGYDVATIATLNVGNFKVTAGNFIGLIGYGVCATIDNVYVDVDFHHAGGWYSPAGLGKAGGVIVSRLEKDSGYAGGPLLYSTSTKVSNCIVKARLHDATKLHINAYSFRGPAGLVGSNGNGDAYPELIENCAILIEKGCGFDNMGSYVGFNAYPFWLNSAYTTTGLKNVKVIEGDSTTTAFDKFLADSDYSFDMFDGLWNMAEINASVFKGTYDGVDNSVIVFGNVDTSLFAMSNVSKIGIRAIRGSDLYEFEFKKEVRADGMFGVALTDLAKGDYRAYVYVQLVDGTELTSSVINFTQVK